MIAHRSSRPYVAAMILSWLMRVLTLLAVLLAPLTMMASHAQASAPAAHGMAVAHDMAGAGGTPGHCPPAGEKQDEQQPAANVDCTIMCSAMPATGGAMSAQLVLAGPDPVQPLEAGGHGLNPAADPPPPRLS